jgi:EF hand
MKALITSTASVILALGIVGSASAADWKGQFGTVDTDGSGTIAQTEYQANVSKLNFDPVPQFNAIDTNNSSSIDADEWAAAEKMVNAFPVSCKSSKESWCPKGY